MKGHPALLSISGKDQLWCSINRDNSRSLNKLNENKEIKKREASNVSIVVEESKVLVQRIQKLFENKLPLIEKIPSESDDSGRMNKGLFESSEDSSINDELLSTKSDSSEILCVNKK